MKSIVQSITKYLNGWRFGFQILLIILTINIVMFALYLVPPGDSALSQFATDFKVWCFGYDPHSGQSETITIIGFLLESLVVFIVAAICWKDKILSAIKFEKTSVILQIVLILTLVLSITTTYYNYYISQMTDQGAIFPAAALRTSFKGPIFSLTNHRNKKITQDDFKGSPLIITAFYAHCATMCPTILNQLKNIYEKVSNLSGNKINFLAITMDPEKDDVETLKDMSEGYELNKENVHFATGNSQVVNKLLDQLSFSRKRNEETGEIDHAGLYLVLDNNYKIAYRFATGEIQEKWMIEAINILSKEVSVAQNRN
jgi:protein SCO1/2